METWDRDRGLLVWTEGPRSHDGQAKTEHNGRFRSNGVRIKSLSTWCKTPTSGIKRKGIFHLKSQKFLSGDVFLVNGLLLKGDICCSFSGSLLYFYINVDHVHPRTETLRLSACLFKDRPHEKAAQIGLLETWCISAQGGLLEMWSDHLALSGLHLVKDPLVGAQSSTMGMTDACREGVIVTCSLGMIYKPGTIVKILNKRPKTNYFYLKTYVWSTANRLILPDWTLSRYFWHHLL